MLPIYAVNTGALGDKTAVALALALVPVVAGLMVSTWPTFSGKAIGSNGKLSFRFTLLMASFAALGFLFDPWLTLTGCAAGYLWSLPLSKLHFNLRRRRTSLP
jgi:phosphatidylserine synthase